MGAPVARACEVSANAVTFDGDTTAKVLTWIHRNVPLCGAGLLMGLSAGVDVGVLLPHPMLWVLGHTPGLGGEAQRSAGATRTFSA